MHWQNLKPCGYVFKTNRYDHHEREEEAEATQKPSSPVPDFVIYKRDSAGIHPVSVCFPLSLGRNRGRSASESEENERNHVF